MMERCVILFKQKTAYEMRISDWSSDVCSSDLKRHRLHCSKGSGVPDTERGVSRKARGVAAWSPAKSLDRRGTARRIASGPGHPIARRRKTGRQLRYQIGRTSSRERVFPYV